MSSDSEYDKPFRDQSGIVSWDQYLAKLKVQGLRPDGSEDLDPTPVEAPIGWFPEVDMFTRMREMVQNELLKRKMEEEGFESEEEADDFEEDGVDFPQSDFEYDDPRYYNIADAGSGRVIPKADMVEERDRPEVAPSAATMAPEAPIEPAAQRAAPASPAKK